MPIYKINESSSISILHEYYIGKNQYTEILRKDIQELRSSVSLNNSDINNSVEIHQLSSDIEKIFGFSHIQVYIYPRKRMNASTGYIYPISGKIDSRSFKKFIKVEKDRIYYDKKADVKVIFLINEGMMYSDKLTDDEILAVMLHEIGHNFENAISPSINGLSFIKDILELVFIIKSFCINKLLGAAVTGYEIFKTIFKEDIYDFIQSLNNKFNYKVFEYNYFLKSLKSETNINEIAVIPTIATIVKKIVPLLFIKGFQNRLEVYSGTRGEIVADSFATLFGYGSELASSLVKMDEEYDKLVDKYVESDKYVNALRIPFEFIESLTYVHPDTAIRLQKQMVYLEKEILKDNLDPEIKKAIHEQMQSIQIQMNKCLEIPDKSDKFYFNKIFKLILIKLDKFTIRDKLAMHGVYKDIDKIFKDV